MTFKDILLEKTEQIKVFAIQYKITIVACIIAIVLTIVLTRISDYKSLIKGFWDVPDAFCERAGIDSGMVYFSDDNTAYLLIKGVESQHSNDENHRYGSDIINKCVKYSLTPSLCNWFSDDVTFKMTFDEDIYPIPDVVDLRISMKNGIIGMFSDDTLHLELVKNAAATCGI